MPRAEIVNDIRGKEILSYLRSIGKPIAYDSTTGESFFLVTRDRELKGELVGITDADKVDGWRRVRVSKIMRYSLRQEGLLHEGF